MKVSVALAAYKGEKYIEEQLKSILAQLSYDDEVIISDDCPGSEMSAQVLNRVETEPRLKYVQGPCQGVIKNFENAISHCTGDIIFLSDQDDVWLPGKVEAVKKEIADGAVLVLHDAKVTDGELNVTEESFFKEHGSAKGYLRNVIRNSYMGCCMAFSKELKQYILPFPENLPMHDQYIGLQAELLSRRGLGKVVFLTEPFILYRQHGGNLTGGKTPLKSKIKWRADIIKATYRRK